MVEEKTRGPTLLALGFRTFYLLASLFAVLGMLVWVLTLHNVAATNGYLAGLTWHGHEMLFGFVAAVIAGFLLTAVRNWTGRPTPTGATLALLGLLWLAGRILAFTGPGPLAAIVDVMFLPALATAIAVPIIKSRNRRNYKILAILLALAVANVVFHFSVAGLVRFGAAQQATAFAIHTVMILLAIVGGRIIPAFTANAVPGSKPAINSFVDTVAFAALVLAALAIAVGAWIEVAAVLLTVIYVVGAAAHALRLALWQPQKTGGDPLLWMLPVAYAWIPLALLLAGLGAAGVIVPLAATHAMAAGAMTSMMIAMMMRSTLGHTGRPLIANKLDVAAFLILQVAALCRVGATLFPGRYGTLVALAGVAWILAFLLYLVHYGPILIRPRIDGRPG